MPLSEEELRLLEQMERALAAEDPKFASALQGRSLQRSARIRVIAAGVVFVAGIGLLLGGAMARMTWLGILGFVVMLGSAVIGLTAWRGRQAPGETGATNTGDALFDFNDPSHPFQVLEGGKANRRPRRTKHQRGRSKGAQGTFMQRMEQRWQRRRDQGY